MARDLKLIFKLCQCLVSLVASNKIIAKSQRITQKLVSVIYYLGGLDGIPARQGEINVHNRPDQQFHSQ